MKSTWPGVSIRFSSYVVPSFASYDMRTAFSLIVIPRSRSRSSVSSTCAFISRFCSIPVASINRSANVDFPWSMWATMQKLRIRDGGVTAGATEERAGD